MNKVRKQILRCLYELNGKNPGQRFPLVTIQQLTGLDGEVIRRETEYLKQKDYIEKVFHQTANLSGYNCRIIAKGIDVLEEEKSIAGRLSRLRRSPYTWLVLTMIAIGSAPIWIPLFGKMTESKQPALQQNDPGISLIYATPVQFRLYKPDEPQVEGQEKVDIRVRLTNQGGSGHVNMAHVRFLTDDGTGHSTDSDKWNEQMGTPALYTIDSIGPLQSKEVSWRPDVPSNAMQLYKSGRATFKLAVHISWQDIAHYKYEYLSLWEVKHNKELGVFIYEPKESYNSLYDKEEIERILKKLVKQAGG